jgi:hypothetical protein
MRIREATQADFATLLSRNVAQEPKEFPAAVNFLYALDDHGKVLATGGLQLLTPCAAWVVLMLDPDAKAKIKEVYRHLRDWLDVMSKTHNLRRLQASIRADFPEGIRLAKHIGFRYESRMPGFYGDVSGLLFARIEEKQT